MNDHQVEARLQELGKDGARVTPTLIESRIVREQYFTAAEGVAGAALVEVTRDGAVVTVGAPIERRDPLGLLTFCVLVLENGFTVTGESACVDPKNYDRELGQRVARVKALEKIWPLEGYLLKQRMHDAGLA